MNQDTGYANDSLKTCQWEFWIDRGGTFTDIIATPYFKHNVINPNSQISHQQAQQHTIWRRGQFITKKLLSENPEQYKDACVEAIRQILELPKNAKIPKSQVRLIRLGTTVATNALLERKGAATAFITTAGFADVLKIAQQHRPDIFALEIKKPETLYQMVIEINERIDVNGEILIPLNEAEIQLALQTIYQKGIRSLAIVLMHGYLYPQHEKIIGQLAQTIGFTQISLSHVVSPLIKIVPRGDTTVVDAYLSPILYHYINNLKNELEPGIPLEFMQSNGGLTQAEFFYGKNSLLSGPAGGVVGAVTAAKSAGFRNMLSFDMGGTSTDMAHYSGEYEQTFDTIMDGVRLRTPMLAVDTLAAGGGSICSFDGQKAKVGPESAGANPGPAAYGRGGPLTITDAHILLGRLRPEFFGNIFGYNHNQPLAIDLVQKQFQNLAKKTQTNPENLARGFLDIANQHMTNGIKKISTARGHNIENHILVAFGGAGGLHVCEIADALNMQQALLHPLAGVLSAYGIGLAPKMILKEQSLNLELKAEHIIIFKKKLEQLKTLTEQLVQQELNFHPDMMFHQLTLYCRYQGSDINLPLIYPFKEILMADNKTALAKKIRTDYLAAHQQQFGFTLEKNNKTSEHSSIIILDFCTLAVMDKTPDDAIAQSTPSMRPLPLPKTSPVFIDNSWQEIPVLCRTDIAKKSVTLGPALIVDETATHYLAPNWSAKLLPDYSLLLRKILPNNAFNNKSNNRSTNTKINSATKCNNLPDGIKLELFNHRFMAIAEQMGVQLEKTAFSVNIKERLDFSCALFDHAGGLIANAPHIPVHLGSMGDAVRGIINHCQTNHIHMQQGDCYITNSPYHGGTHLPDLTAISPVMINKKIVFFVASRGHHTDIGGVTPSSMPAFSTDIKQEGILIDFFHLVRGKVDGQNQWCEQELRQLLSQKPFPARNIAQNISDLRAQVASNQQGIILIQHMIDELGLSETLAYVQFVRDYAKSAIRSVISQLQDGHFIYEMDNGAVIKVAITIDKIAKKARLDFSGSSPELNNNFNAPFAITKSVVLYVFRCLTDHTIPLNEGCLEPIEIILPQHSMLCPAYPRAVVAGNVETSQVIADCIFGALQILAGSQGTMNNLTFGNETTQYYETIGGGAPAGRYLNFLQNSNKTAIGEVGFHGADAVHCHMTNSRMTDPEILEKRYPVRVEQFAIRQETGGVGQYHGGNGFHRAIRFLEPMTINIIANRRIIPPFGLKGGGTGAVGEQYIVRQDGSHDTMASCDQRIIQKNELLVIKTPGGGGYLPVKK